MSKSRPSFAAISDSITATDIPVNPVISVDVDSLASAIHNAQVSELRKQAEESGTASSFSFSTWDDLTETSKESRRSTARYLLTKFDILTK